MKKRMNCIGIMAVLFFCSVEGNAIVVYDDGGLHEIATTITDDVEIYDGPSSQPTTVKLVAGGFINDVDVYQNSIFLMTGGIYGASLVLHNQSQAEISDGIVDEDPFTIKDNSRLTITGSDFSEGLRVRNEGQVFIYGSDFQIDSVPVPYGPISVTTGLLEGTLWNGQIRSNLDIQNNGIVTLVPEPASLSLLLLGTLLVRRKRKLES